MEKRIVKVMVFYNDGTFDECIAGAMVQPSLTYPPGVRTPQEPHNVPTPWVVPPCHKCGSTNKINCTIPDCPTGWGKPWDNRNKVID